MPKCILNDHVKVISYQNHRYVGLTGKVVWIGDNQVGDILYQVETDTKPPYYRPSSPPWTITVRENEIESYIDIRAILL